MKKIVIISSLMLCLCGFSMAQTRQPLPVQQDMIKFYPNPASFFINFEFQKAYDRTHILQIYNFMGKKVQEVRNTPSRISLRLDEYYRGIYIFQLRDKFGHILESGRFQVIK